MYGNGCCRYDGWSATHRGYKSRQECLAICAANDDCIAFDIARPNDNKYDCYTFSGSGNNFHTECGTTNPDELCFKKSGQHAINCK